MEAPLAQVVDTFRGAGGAAEFIVAAQRTRAGDVILQLATLEAKEGLDRAGDWPKKVCSSAHMLRQTTPIIAHNVRVAAVDDKDQGAAIETIKEANRILHPELDIAGVE